MDTSLLLNTQERKACYQFKLKEFEGPLDLLLFLIKQNRVNLYDIPISQITEQYMDYLGFSGELELDELSDFYVMAATLLYIKSRMLLPLEFGDSDEIEDPRQELVDQLIEYQRFKKLSELMEEKEREAEWVVERKKLQHVLPFDDDDVLWKKADVWELLNTFSSLVSHLSGERVMDLREEVSINEKIALMTELIEQRGGCSFTDLLVRKGSIMDIVCAFLAILEAVKYRLATIYQHKLFGDIQIRGPELESIPAPDSDGGEKQHGNDGK
ncbi:MAG: segregation/condensation protein A [Spirochaetaceae bacterium]|jgi:segregation and condensation protein A|nr:segregation/condensation protein A [Spirochaetaceae bacterium]